MAATWRPPEAVQVVYTAVLFKDPPTAATCKGGTCTSRQHAGRTVLPAPVAALRTCRTYQQSGSQSGRQQHCTTSFSLFSLLYVSPRGCDYSARLQGYYLLVTLPESTNHQLGRAALPAYTLAGRRRDRSRHGTTVLLTCHVSPMVWRTAAAAPSCHPQSLIGISNVSHTRAIERLVRGGKSGQARWAHMQPCTTVWPP